MAKRAAKKAAPAAKKAAPDLRTPAKEPSAVQKAAAQVVEKAKGARAAIGALADARSAAGELAPEDWEAIQEAHLAIGEIPRPS